MPQVQLGDRVRVQYCRVPDRNAADGKRPVNKTCEFTVGGTEVFPTLSSGVAGMSPGESKQLTLQPLEAYGAVRPKLIRAIPRKQFPEHLVLTVGKRLIAVHGTAGRRRRVTVLEVGADSVVVDGNHPLAGKSIDLEVKLVSVDSPAGAKRRKAKPIGGNEDSSG